MICAVRSLLPEGEIYNNTRIPFDQPTGNAGAVTIGCSRVGCEQLILGGCCEDHITCTDDPPAPQLAVIDAYGAVVYGVFAALCRTLRELDPCTSELTLRNWGRRYGLVSADPCAPQWSDDVLRALLCILPQIKGHVLNWDYLQALAGMFGASLTIHAAGDFSECGPAGWWTMARDWSSDKPVPVCPPPDAEPQRVPWMRLVPSCLGQPDSLNLILSPAEIMPPATCNLPPRIPQPHDPDLYAAFLWLLPKILPSGIFWCVYSRDELNCIV